MLLYIGANLPKWVAYKLFDDFVTFNHRLFYRRSHSASMLQRFAKTSMLNRQTQTNNFNKASHLRKLHFYTITIKRREAVQ